MQGSSVISYQTAVVAPTWWWRRRGAVMTGRYPRPLRSKCPAAHCAERASFSDPLGLISASERAVEFCDCWSLCVGGKVGPNRVVEPLLPLLAAVPHFGDGDSSGGDLRGVGDKSRRAT